MRQAARWMGLLFLGTVLAVAFPPAGPAATPVMAGYLENVTFEKLPGKERVILTASKPVEMKVENQPGRAVAVRLDNLFVPEELRRPLVDSGLDNVLKVTPLQRTGQGRSWMLAMIELRQKVPYSVRQEGSRTLIDFNTGSLAAAAPVTASAAPLRPLPSAGIAEDTKAGDSGGAKAYAGSRIFLDVQEADIKAVFRLLAEQGKVSIVSGDDVKGTVTVHLRDVPWEQAFDTILRIKGLGKRQDGNVITVMTLERLKKDETERLALQQEDQLREPQITRVVPIAYNDPEELKKNIEDLLKSQAVQEAKAPVDPKAAAPTPAPPSSLGSVTIDKHTRSLIIKATRRDMDMVLRFIERIDKPTEQIQIKANIVETTKTMARNLGIQWGGVYGRYVGNQGLYITPGGTGGSTVPPGSALAGSYTPLSGATGISGQGYGVNFPAAAILGTNPAALAMQFGTIGGNILDVQLSALQKDGKLKILSSPSLRTQDNQMASTEHGEEVPVVTPATSTNPPTVTFKKAVLRLEITPHVIDGRHIRMTLLVKKDEADFTRQVQGNPPLFVKETKTDLVVADGETIVISGLTKQKRQDDNTGVPGLKEVPVLGWLFKGEEKDESLEEVLIFITPTIVKAQVTDGIQEGT